jgi:coniferyl-aldehyde dehydrogenase
MSAVSVGLNLEPPMPPPDLMPTAPTLVEIFQSLRGAAARDPFPSHAERADRLDRLLAMTEEAETEWVRAIDADFAGRSSHETRLAELFVVCSAIRHARSCLRQWMRPSRVPTRLPFKPAHNRLLPQPLGVVGIVAPWNYPFQLAAAPAIDAIAAGNRVMIKPSELAPRLSALLAEQVERRFSAQEMRVVTGDADIARAFVRLPFDHLLFTGSTAVGREVALAAAANLTPVTLELGGKSPAIVDASARFAAAADSIAAGKMLNAGQTCIAPDHVLVPKGRGLEFSALVAQAIGRMYPRLVDNPDYTAIISMRHRQRLQELLSEAEGAGARVITVNPAQETCPPGSRKVLPALVLAAPEGIRLMREEIFGPILPIIEVDGAAEAVAHVNRADRPLALYWFGEDAHARDRVLIQTVSGGVTVNDTLLHLAQESQPFGGVGASGTGAYHGAWGFRAFSKEKPVFYQSRWNGTGLLRPPYGPGFERLLGLLKRIT